jgi:hypothetical protein
MVKAGGPTVVVTITTELLAMTGSTWLAEAVAALVCAPNTVALAVKVNVADPPLGSEPIVQVNVPCTLDQFPAEALPDNNVNPGGIWTNTAALAAGAGP